MVDSVVLWARDYKVDGFRFDLMGHHSRENMLAVRTALDALTVEKDGVDGASVYLYGEGWNFGEVANNARFTRATQGQLGGTQIGAFSDRLRDAVRGGGPFDEDPRKQGFGSGELTDDNGADINDDAAASLEHDTDLVQLGLAGNLRSFAFRSNEFGEARRPADVRRRTRRVRGPAGRGRHLRRRPRQRDVVRQPGLQAALGDRHGGPRADELAVAGYHGAVPDAVVLARGRRPAALEVAGPQATTSGDWFNTLDWTGKDNGFGHGLPLKADNENKWPYMKPLLEKPALKPTADDVQAATARRRTCCGFGSRARCSGSGLRRRSTPRCPSPRAARPTRAGRHRDADRRHAGRRRRPGARGPARRVQRLRHGRDPEGPGLAGAGLALSPVQAQGSDAVVKAATWDAATGSATVPARTVAVFLQR